jgi:hypothetical protein
MMDALVLAAMANWPNMTAVYGWLRFDARGQWWLDGSRVEHAGLLDFLQRNYARDVQGRYYVQNGPQQVYVDLDAAPFVARHAPGGWSLTPPCEELVPRAAFLTDDGDLYLEMAGELARLDDRDWATLAESRVDGQGRPAGDAELAGFLAGQQRLSLQLPEGGLPLERTELAALVVRYGVDRAPQPPAGACVPAIGPEDGH